MKLNTGKIIRVLGYIIASLLLLIILLILLLQIPSVQTKIAGVVTDKIGEKTNTKIHIGKVAINFIDNVSLKDIYVEDLEKDTLLYAGVLNVNIGIFKLLSRTVDIENIRLENAVLNLKQGKDSIFNFQFLVDAFSSKDTATIPNTSKPYTIEIGDIDLKNIRARARLLSGDNTLNLNSLHIDINTISIEKKTFDLSTIEIDGLNLVSSTKPSPPITPNGRDSVLLFPLKDLPVTIKCDNLEINESTVAYTEEGAQTGKYFNPKDIHADNLTLHIKDILVDSTQAKADIRKFNLGLNGKFTLSSLNGKIHFTNRESDISDLTIKTGLSEGKVSLNAGYPGFESIFEDPGLIRASLKTDSLHIALSEIIYFVPMLDTMQALSKYKNSVLKIDTDIKGSSAEAVVDYLKASIDRTNLEFSGIVSGMTDPDKLTIAKGKLKAASDASEIKPFLEKGNLSDKINHFGHVEIQSDFEGSLKHLRLDRFDLSTQGILQLRASGSVNNPTDMERLAYNLKIDKAATGYGDLKVFADSLPEMVQHLKSIIYQGTIRGTRTEYFVDGALITSLGTIGADLHAKFNKDYSDATYKGDIGIRDFDIGTLIDNDSFGRVNLTASVNGQGIDPKSIRADIEANVISADFNSYTYRDLLINGRVDGMQYKGNISIKDKNITLDFNGLVNFNDSLPVMDFKANIDTLNLHALHLIDYPLQMKMKIDAGLSGINADDVIGSVAITNVALSNTADYWTTDSIIFTAERLDANRRSLKLNSSFAKMDISGKYKVANLTKIMVNFADQYFPFSKFIGGAQPSDVIPPGEERQLNDEKIDFSLSLIKPVDITKFFLPGLKKLDSAKITFALDAPEKLIDFQLSIPGIQYADYYIDNISAVADNKGEILKAVFSADSVSIAKGVAVKGIKINASMSDRKANISAYVANDTNGYSLGFNTLLSAPDNAILASFENPFYLNAQEWQISQNHPLDLKKGLEALPRFTLQNGSEKLEISGDSSQVSVDFNRFDLQNIFGLVKLDSTKVEGFINGNIHIGMEPSSALLTGDLNIDDIKINAREIGNIALKADKKGNIANANLVVSGHENDIQTRINYDLNSKKIDGSLNINRLYISPFELFFQTMATGTSGYLFGQLRISGTTSNPLINGDINFNEVSAVIRALGTKYMIQRGAVSLSDGLIRPDITFVDTLNRPAYLRGSITHKYFQDMAFDLNFRTDAFTFLNSSKNQNDPFYGKFVAKLNADITGNIDLPKIRATLVTVDESDVTVQLLTPEVALEQENYIIFVDGIEKYSMKQIDSLANEKYKVSSKIDLVLNATITDNALVHLIIDPITGDNLEIKGDAELVIKIPPSGNISVTGTYTVKGGNYRFSYQNLLKRNFEIVSGSRVILAGNPMDARLDIKARYKTQASAMPLLKNDISSLSESETNTLRKRMEVSVLLNINGKISNPNLSFDIQVPQNSSSPVGNSVTQALDRIRTNESDLNKEVFSILLFNSFTGSSSTGNITSTGSATAIRSVGNLINSQLNQLAGKVEGLQIDFDLDQYQDEVSQGGGNVTQVDLGLSQSLFDDRVVISVGGNVDLESGNTEREGLSGIAGDFVLEYKISENGKYRVRVFQKSDYDALTQDNLWKTGVGFTYKTKFGKIKRNKSKTTDR